MELTLQSLQMHRVPPVLFLTDVVMDMAGKYDPAFKPYMPLLSLDPMDIQFLLIQPKSTFPCHVTVTEEISVPWQVVRSPVNAFESEQLRQIGMPGRNDGMKLHGLGAKCK